ncbi:MAG: carboxylesterase family protein [Gammaproteobacteria bacterium]|nr:carboxylesterase family protein [Gammaproteobacteria bacterium]
MKKLAIVLVIVIVAPIATGYWYVSRFSVTTEPPLAAEETRRAIDSGELTGFLDRGSYAWTGIPYAQPPVGNLRWKAPRLPSTWASPREALTFGSACPQSGFGQGEITGDEDCLYLNIWAPADSANLRPVMFFIHGGGNHLGEGSTPIYRGARYATDHAVVVVTINYRLGPFGWLRHPGLRTQQNAADDSGNYGTLDIIEALAWVRRNIAEFGGDPANVTIFGESAGGFDVLTLMVSPLAKGLYHKAIVQSGGMTLLPPSVAENYSDDPQPGHPLSSRELVNKLLIEDGSAVDRAAAKDVQLSMSDPEVAQYLLSKTTLEIMTAQDRLLEPPGEAPVRRPFILGESPNKTPYIFGDGFVLPADKQLDVLFADSDSYNVTPVILGSNRDESKLFMMAATGYTDTLFGIPYRLREETAYERDTSYGSKLWKANAVDELAITLRETQGASVYAYRFDWDEMNTVATLELSKLIGAGHALELPFVFGNFDLADKTLIFGKSPERAALSASMMSYWAEFAYSGNPGRGRDNAQIQWQPWVSGLGEERILLLDTTTDSGIRMSPLLVTRETIRQDLLADDRFDSTEARCDLYQRMFKGASSSAEDMVSLGCD